MSFQISLVFAFVAAASLVAAVSADCSACAGVLAPVLGKDGLPYINSCVARCSGAQIAAAGASAANQAGYAGRSVSSSLMQAHAAEGFRFVNFDRVHSQKPGSVAGSSAPSLAGLPADRVVRHNVAHGAVYASAAPVAAAGASNTAAQLEQEPTQVMRKLQQQAASAPSAAVGQLLTYGERSRCTATLVAERTVVTAASCVFDRKTGAFARSLYFVLGRDRTAGGLVVAPHGAADVAEVFILSSFIKGNSAADAAASDIAVVRLQRSAHTGSSFSYGAAPAAPKQQEEQQIAASRRMLLAPSTGSNTLWTAGYPSTAAEGAKVETECIAQQQSGAIIKLGCQVHSGQAGAPVYDAQGVLRGVITSAAAGSSSAVSLTPSLWQTLVKPYLV